MGCSSSMHHDTVAVKGAEQSAPGSPIVIFDGSGVGIPIVRAFTGSGAATVMDGEPIGVAQQQEQINHAMVPQLSGAMEDIMTSGTERVQSNLETSSNDCIVEVDDDHHDDGGCASDKGNKTLSSSKSFTSNVLEHEDQNSKCHSEATADMLNGKAGITSLGIKASEEEEARRDGDDEGQSNSIPKGKSTGESVDEKSQPDVEDFLMDGTKNSEVLKNDAESKQPKDKEEENTEGSIHNRIPGESSCWPNVEVDHGEGAKGDMIQPKSDRTDLYVQYGFENWEEYEEALLKFATQQEAVEQGSGGWENAFGGGSKEEYNLEKDFENVMTGKEELEKKDFELEPCTCAMDGAEHAKDCEGKWLRTMNQQETCFLYIHTITHAIRGTRPTTGFNIGEEEELVGKDKIVEQPKIDIPRCSCEEIIEFARRLKDTDKKTLLVLIPDKLQSNVVSYLERISAIIVNTRPFVLPVRRTGIKFSDAIETARVQVKTATKEGKVLVIDLADRSPDFEDKIAANPKYKNMFPMDVFDAAKQWYCPTVFIRSKGDGRAVLHSDFLVVALSTIPYNNVARELKDCIPLDKFHVVELKES